MPKFRPFNPETDIPVCFMHEHENGRILSRGFAVPNPKTRQYAPACDVKKGLPTKADFESHSLTTDARLVTCPKCHQTEAFLEAYLSQVGVEFDIDKIMENGGIYK